ncbi:MAG: cytochrome c biogenesis protein CcsA [Bdellovibrionaceae bacterium]|nr:cytochrome c biogenesis protein CcsA [Pseudobdellovibrionaceae bacterium]
MIRRNLLALLTLLFPLFVFASLAQASSPLDRLPVQEGGRIKPYDTFAREHLALIYGKQSFEEKPATEIVMTWILQPKAWEEKQFFEIRHHLVKRGLKLEETRMHFSPQEILSSDRLSVVMRDLQAKRETKEKLDPYFQAIQRLENQLFTFREIASGRMLRILPPKEGETWIALNEMPQPFQDKFMEITKEFVGTLNPEGDTSAARAALKTHVDEFIALVQAENPALFPSMTKVDTEVSYNRVHPFRYAYTSYLLALVAMGFFWMFKKPGFVTATWVFSVIGLLLHIYGFGVRTYLTDRAPVTNMYETVVWVSLGTVVFAMIIEWIYRWRFIITAGAAVGAFCLILADMAPAVLDASIQPLEPVLRSNFWLTTHVLTITISYAAFFLAFALGDYGLYLFLRDEKRFQDRIRGITLALYRAIQIGIAFLAPGIILGGIWADYSWGRFWGWDPKETWALIALLGYLAVLHGRLAGLLRNFGMCAAAILTFSLVIMAWYGVNYVLGAGLHSYGFGAGGVEYVAGFVALHILYVVFVGVVRRDSIRS